MKKYKVSRSLAGWLGAAIVVGVPLRSAAEEIPLLAEKIGDFDKTTAPLISLSFKPTPTSGTQPLYVRTVYDEQDKQLMLCEFWTIGKQGKKHSFSTRDDGPTPQGLHSLTLKDFNLDGNMDLRVLICTGSGGSAYQFFTWKKDRFVLWEETEDMTLCSDGGGDTMESSWRTGGGSFFYTKYRIKNGKFVPLVSVETVEKDLLKPYEAKNYPKFSDSGQLHIQYIYQDGKPVRKRLYDHGKERDDTAE